MKSRTLRGLALLLILCGLLWGCAQTPRPTEPETQPSTQPPNYTVTFLFNGREIARQEVAAGACPEKVSVDNDGVLFVAWQNAEGKKVAPETLAVTADTVYEAAYFPILDRHVPYLFPDDAGLLNPQSPLTGGDLALALEALAAQGAQEHFPRLPEANTQLSRADLREILTAFFTPTELERAFGMASGEELTRGGFALLMNGLLSRGGEETVALDQPVLPMDVTGGDAESLAVLEAAVSHHEDSSGSGWAILRSVTAQGTGFVNVSGWLYYVDAQGIMARDTTIGTLTFGADGRYTSGDTELDQLVADILKQLMKENPEAKRLELLRAAFDYCVESFTYLRKNAYAFGENGWEATDAKVMFTGARGNCYNFAAAFWALARGLGYDAVAYSGSCTSTDQPHGWVEIDMEDGRYIFDPEWQWAYIDRGDYSKDMFMVPIAAGSWWNYKRYN